jgi:formylglycine-generating enzyme required for sulfatase activity
VYGLHLYTGEITDTATKLLNSLKKIAWFDANCKVNGTIHRRPVGCLKPNAYGLYDVLGNVPEVCLDFYAANYAATGANPAGPDYSSSSPAGNRVQRGRGYNNWGLYCAWRDSHAPTSAAVGVRVCCTIEE